MLAAMDVDHIGALLQPFAGDDPLPDGLLAQLQTYLDLLLRWNSRVNLTAIRDPEQIVTRHFGESLFAARLLRDDGAFTTLPTSLADVGSGAGFPGVPIKLFAPEIHLTLIESQNKKATFLKELIRVLSLENAEVYSGRAELWGGTADIVTMRAVERFQSIFPDAAKLVRPGGRICLLVSAVQPMYFPPLGHREKIWNVGKLIPYSDNRYVLVGKMQ